MQKNNKKGFTLIELLVVIAIIGLLTTLAVVALDSARTKSRDAKRVTDVRQIQTALELYFNDQDGYPGTAGFTGANTLGVDMQCLDSAGFGTLIGDCANPIYMGQLPTDITPYAAAAAGYFYETNDGGSGGCTTAICPGYTIIFGLEGNAGELDGPGTFQASTDGIIKL